MKKIFTILLAALGLNTACSQNFENMEVKEFAELIADSNVVILDVRKADEFAEGHIKDAILIDQFQSDFIRIQKRNRRKKASLGKRAKKQGKNRRGFKSANGRNQQKEPKLFRT